MAQPQTSVLTRITQKAQALQQELQAKGINAADKENIVKTAQTLLGLLDEVQPELNRAQAAFGGQQDQIAQMNELRNKLNKVIAAYS